MSFLELGLLGVVGVLTASLTAVVGYGGGTILIAVLLMFMPPAVAIPFHGVVQLFSNGWRVVLFRSEIAWGLVLRFALLLPLGVATGLWFFVGLSTEAIQVLIGCFVLVSLYTRRLRRFRDKDLPLWAFVPLGYVVGILNMLVGVVAPLLGVLTVRRELNKEGLIGTLGSFAVLGHVFKVGAFGLVGFRFADHALALAVMIPAVMAGGSLGKWVLSYFSESVFQVVFRIVLVVLALKLIVWEGLLKGLL